MTNIFHDFPVLVNYQHAQLNILISVCLLHHCTLLQSTCFGSTVCSLREYATLSNDTGIKRVDKILTFRGPRIEIHCYKTNEMY